MMARYQYGANDTKRRRRLKDKKIVIYRRMGEETSYTGGMIKPVHPGKLWAYVRQLSGDEIHRGKQDHYDEDILFVVNYRSDHADWDHILYRGIFYNITRVDTYEGYKSDLTVYANNIRGQPDPRQVQEW